MDRSNDLLKLIEAAFEATDSGICILNSDKKIIRANLAFCDILGYTENKVLGNTFKDVVKYADYTDVSQNENLNDSGFDKSGYWAKYNGGGRVRIKADIREIEVDSDHYEVYTIHDITPGYELNEVRDALSDSLPGTIFQYEKNPGGEIKMRAVSKGSKELWGYTPEEVMEDPQLVWNTIHEDDLQRMKESVEESAKNLSIWEEEYRAIRPDGKLRWIRAKGKPRGDAHGNTVWNTLALDITNEKEIQEELNKTSKRLVEATHIASLGYWDLNFETHQMNWSDMTYKIMGLDENVEPNPEIFHDYVFEGDRERVEKAVNNTIETRVPFDEVFRIKINNKISWVHSKGKLSDDGILFKGSVQDVTAQKEREQNLHLLESVVTNTEDSVLITEAEPIEMPGPRILYVNQAFEKLTGYRPDEVIGNTPRILQGPESQREELDKLRESLEKWEPHETTMVNYRKNGEEFWINFKCIPVADDKGWFTHWIAIERDVTAIKEEQRQKELIVNITSAMAEITSFTGSLEKVNELFLDSGEFEFSEVWLMNNRTAKYEFINGSYVRDKSLDYYDQKEAKSLLEEDIFAGQYHKAEKVFHIEDLKNNPQFSIPDKVCEIGKISVCVISLTHAGEGIGALVLGIDGKRKNTFRLREYLKDLGSFLGTEIERKKLENNLRNIYDTIPAILCKIDQDKCLTWMNKKGAEILAYNKDELEKKSVESFIHPEDIDVFRDNFVLEKEQEGSFETRLIDRKKEIVNILWSTVFDESEKVVFAVGKDISDARKLQRISDEASKMAKIGSWVINFEFDSIYWSKMTREIHEVDEEYEPNLDEAINFYKEGKDREIIRECVRKAFEEGKSYDVELKIITAGNNEKWVRAMGSPEFVDGKCVAIKGSFQDIDGLKRVELQSMRNLKEKESILESIGEAFFAVDKNFTVYYWNKQAEEIMNVSKESILGKNLLEVLRPIQNSESIDYYREALEKGKDIEFEVYEKELKAWFSVNAFYSNGRLSVYLKDITKNKEYIREIEERNILLENIAWTQSHKVRAPLARILGIADILENSNGADEDNDELLRHLIDSTHELDKVIRSIVSLSEK